MMTYIFYIVLTKAESCLYYQRFFFPFSLHRKVRIIMNDFSLLNNTENSIQFFLTTVSTRVL